MGTVTVHRELSTVDDTLEFGRQLGAALRAGDLVVLVGPLGAGKTVLARGIGAGLGVAGEITSPTFVISRIHRPAPDRGGKLTMVHVDAYRLGGITEVDDLDLDATIEDSVTVVEWGQGIVEQLADAHLEIRINRRDDDEVRELTLIAHGANWPSRIAVLT
jgi:tRNA threonylcarbamoyladenosine biosynthesis protein TsaE